MFKQKAKKAEDWFLKVYFAILGLVCIYTSVIGTTYILWSMVKFMTDDRTPLVLIISMGTLTAAVLMLKLVHMIRKDGIADSRY